ncbi:MAG: MucB/RseB C-terminal domain-containing protein [Gammaproteobacteria bacterium]|nr:MucB/RseB C-terminal domain-containing protein [Gammaproteobacteria bacterium]
MAHRHPELASLAALLGLFAASGLARAADGPQEWLRRMEQALTTRNYDGVFVHEHGGQSETLRILHRVRDGEVAERIVSMDGSGREFIRRGGEISTYLPDQRLVLVEQAPDSGLLLAEVRAASAAVSGNYVVSDAGRARVAGRNTCVIEVAPRDAYRYGYRIWIDAATAMPLKSQLHAADGRVVEQLIFTSLSLPAQVPDAVLQPAVDARDYRWLRHTARSAVGEAPVPAWQPEDLPPGFRMTVRSTQRLPGSGRAVTHLVFSDGLASVSVFVGPRDLGAEELPIDARSVGSSSAFSTTLDGRRVTAIGEVPPGTVRAIARSLRSGAQLQSGPRPPAGGDGFGPPIRSSTRSEPR